MRIWWLVLILTISAAATLAMAPPTTEHGYLCEDAAAWILITPGYTEIEGGGLDQDRGPSPCAQAAQDQFGFAAGVGVVGGAATWAIRCIGSRRRARSTHSADLTPIDVSSGS